MENESRESANPESEEVKQLTLLDSPEKKAKTQPRAKKEVKTMSQQVTEDPCENQKDELGKIDFEASLAELEGVVRQLDSEVKLDRALELFESGIRLSVDCETFIKGARKKIEILKKKADGTAVAEEYQGEAVKD